MPGFSVDIPFLRYCRRDVLGGLLTTRAEAHKLREHNVVGLGHIVLLYLRLSNRTTEMESYPMTTSSLSHRTRTLIFLNIVISCIASSMLATALTTALPPITRDLSLSIPTGQWLTSGYSLVMAITMPLTAFLISRFPTKRLYCAAILIFLSGLLISAVSTGFLSMMTGRVIQAVGNGILSSMAQVMILTIFPLEKRGSAMGWYGLSVGAAPVVAPTVAGILVDTVGWRMIFWAALCIMALSFLCALLVFSNVLNTTKPSFDLASFFLSALAFGGLTLGIGNMGTYGLQGLSVLLPLVLGLAAGVVFVRRQLRLETPFLELRILRNKSYAVSVAGSMLLYFIMMGSSLLLPLYAQETLGLSATLSALILLPGSLLSAVVSPFAGTLYDKVGMRTLFLAGGVCLLASNALMVFLRLQTPIWVISLSNVIRSMAIACLLMPLVTWGASNVAPAMTAHATALLTSLRTIAGAMGSAVFVALFTSISTRSAERYGSLASVHGANMTFLAMAVCSVLLLALAFFGTRAAVRAPASWKHSHS